MIQQMTNRELAQEISARIGNAPIPFDSVYSIALQIYQELGGEGNDFDSVYSILLEILPLAEQVAKKTSITEVDELPEANDNNNIYRLSSDDKVYMSVRYPDTFTNKLPDNEQIDKAFLYLADDKPYYYKGAWKIICSDGEVDGYGWLETYSDSDKWYFVLTQDNAVFTTIDSKGLTCGYDTDEIDLENHTIITEYPIAQYQWENAATIYSQELYPVSATYNAPEADCIGNAYLVDTEMSTTWVYDGTEVQYEDDETGKQCIGYKWVSNPTPSDSKYAVTSKKASEIYYFKGTGWAHSDTIIRVVSTSDVGIGADYEDLYIPQLNAPDSEQVGKASLNDTSTEEVYCYYAGIEKTVVLADRTFNVYLWGDDEESPMDWYYTTLKPANQIHGGSDLIADSFDGFDGWVVDGNTVTNTGVTYDEFVNNCVHSIADGGLSVHTVPYQRVLENWQWKQIPTMDDIPQTTVINIASTGATELAKLNDFKETGVYDSNILKLTYLGYPAQLIVGEFVQVNIKYTAQWIRYYNPQNFYSEYVYGRQYNHSTKQWENNPLGEYPIELFNFD